MRNITAEEMISEHEHGLVEDERKEKVIAVLRLRAAKGDQAAIAQLAMIAKFG